MKYKISIFLILLILACKSPEDFKNLCNPSHIFKDEDKGEINLQLMVDNVFDPFCSPCHTTDNFLSSSSAVRIGYLPLDKGIIGLKNDFNFKNTLANYINFQEADKSKLVKALKEAGVRRAGDAGIIEYQEPRNRCEMPDDVIQGVIWWIENSNGSMDKLLQ
jgi:hypothetical protein